MCNPRTFPFVPVSLVAAALFVGGTDVVRAQCEANEQAKLLAPEVKAP